MSRLSLKEQQIGVYLLPSTTLKLLQVNYYTVSCFVVKEFLKICLNFALWRLQETCHVLSLHLEAEIFGASICPCWLSLYVLFVILKLIVKVFNFFKAFFGQVVWHFNLCNFGNYTNSRGVTVLKRRPKLRHKRPRFLVCVLVPLRSLSAHTAYVCVKHVMLHSQYSSWVLVNTKYFQLQEPQQNAATHL